MPGMPGFFDVNERLKRLSELGAQLEAYAEAAAKAIKLRGEAEAAAIDARGKALRDNPALVALTQAERWDGKLPTTMVPNGSVPMLSGFGPDRLR